MRRIYYICHRTASGEVYISDETENLAWAKKVCRENNRRVSKGTEEHWFYTD